MADLCHTNKAHRHLQGHLVYGPTPLANPKRSCPTLLDSSAKPGLRTRSAEHWNKRKTYRAKNHGARVRLSTPAPTEPNRPMATSITKALEFQQQFQPLLKLCPQREASVKINQLVSPKQQQHPCPPISGTWSQIKWPRAQNAIETPMCSATPPTQWQDTGRSRNPNDLETYTEQPFPQISPGPASDLGSAPARCQGKPRRHCRTRLAARRA